MRELSDLWIGGKGLTVLLLYCTLLGGTSFLHVTLSEQDLIPPKEMVYAVLMLSLTFGLLIGLVLGAEVEGKAIGTIEGMANGTELHPLQQKFLEHAALQCGICTPGVLVAAKALLERNPDPTEEEARYWLAGNLCRCTGYNKIIEAVLDAAAEMRRS